MTTPTIYKSLYKKPTTVRFSIPLKKGEYYEGLMRSFQAKIKPDLYFLHQNKETGKYYFTNSKGDLVPTTKLPPVCAFVILEREDGYLEPILGKGNHAIISGGANEVRGVGDIYFDKKIIDALPVGTIYFDIKKITKKMTDQSGGYHVDHTHPFLQEIRNSTKAAMKACGFPTEKLEYFTEPDFRSLCAPSTEEAILKIFEAFHQDSRTALPTPNAVDLKTPQKPLLFSDPLAKESDSHRSEKLEAENALLIQQLLEIEPSSGAAPAA